MVLAFKQGQSNPNVTKRRTLRQTICGALLSYFFLGLFTPVVFANGVGNGVEEKAADNPHEMIDLIVTYRVRPDDKAHADVEKKGGGRSGTSSQSSPVTRFGCQLTQSKVWLKILT